MHALSIAFAYSILSEFEFMNPQQSAIRFLRMFCYTFLLMQIYLLLVPQSKSVPWLWVLVCIAFLLYYRLFRIQILLLAVIFLEIYVQAINRFPYTHLLGFLSNQLFLGFILAVGVWFSCKDIMQIISLLVSLMLLETTLTVLGGMQLIWFKGPKESNWLDTWWTLVLCLQIFFAFSAWKSKLILPSVKNSV